MNRLTDPKKAILVFLFLILLVPFYESKRMLIWSTQRLVQKENFFNSLLVAYLEKGEEVKKQLGWDSFFDAEHDFWLKTKKSPIVFKGNAAPLIEEKKETSEKESVVEENYTIEPPSSQPIASSSQPSNIPTSSLTATITLPSLPQKIKPFFKLSPPYRILIIGDSFMAIGGGVGNPLERSLLNYKDVAVYRYGKVSSGLSRPDYFNWELKVQELISQYSPNVAIVMLGTNDAQALTSKEGKIVVGYENVGTDEWNKEYGKRVSAFLDLFKENNITVFWIGLPIMREEDFSKKIQNLNSIYESEIKKYENAYFISTWNILADENGNYAHYLPDKEEKMKLARASDGIHLTYFGGELVAERVISKMKEVMELKEK